jgi:hypothetical protein
MKTTFLGMDDIDIERRVNVSIIIFLLSTSIMMLCVAYNMLIVGIE